MLLIFLPKTSLHTGGRTFLYNKSIFGFVFQLLFLEGHLKIINKMFSVFYFSFGSKSIKVYSTYPFCWSQEKSMHLSSYAVNILALSFSWIISQLSRIIKCQWPVGHHIRFQHLRQDQIFLNIYNHRL